MEKYIVSNEYDDRRYFIEAIKASQKELKEVNVSLNRDNNEDNVIITELFTYKTSSKIPSVTELYLQKNKYRNLEKKKC